MWWFGGKSNSAKTEEKKSEAPSEMEKQLAEFALEIDETETEADAAASTTSTPTASRISQLRVPSEKGHRRTDSGSSTTSTGSWREMVGSALHRVTSGVAELALGALVPCVAGAERTLANISATAAANVVGDVEKYPTFVPKCSRINAGPMDADGRQHVEMTIDLGKDYPMLVGYTKVVLATDNISGETREGGQVTSRYVIITATDDSPPIHALKGKWEIKPLPGKTMDERGCIVSFHADFEVPSHLKAIIESVLSTIYGLIIGAFEAQAQKLEAAAATATSPKAKS